MKIYVYRMKVINEYETYTKESYDGTSRFGYKTLEEAEKAIYEELMILDPRCDDKLIYYCPTYYEYNISSPVAIMCAETRGGDVHAEIYEVEL